MPFLRLFFAARQRIGTNPHTERAKLCEAQGEAAQSSAKPLQLLFLTRNIVCASKEEVAGTLAELFTFVLYILPKMRQQFYAKLLCLCEMQKFIFPLTKPRENDIISCVCV